MKWNRFWSSTQYSVICSWLHCWTKHICFPEVGLQMHQWEYLLSSTAKTTDLHSSPRKSETLVPHSAWQVLNLQVREVGLGSNYTATDLTRGSHRTSNSSKRDSFWFSSISALPADRLEHPGVQPAGCGLHPDAFNEQRMRMFYFWPGNQELDSGTEVCQCALSPAEGPLLTPWYFSREETRL